MVAVRVAVARCAAPMARSRSSLPSLSSLSSSLSPRPAPCACSGPAGRHGAPASRVCAAGSRKQSRARPRPPRASVYSEPHINNNNPSPCLVGAAGGRRAAGGRAAAGALLSSACAVLPAPSRSSRRRCCRTVLSLIPPPCCLRLHVLFRIVHTGAEEERVEASGILREKDASRARPTERRAGLEKEQQRKAERAPPNRDDITPTCPRSRRLHRRNRPDGADIHTAAPHNVWRRTRQGSQRQRSVGSVGLLAGPQLH